jgi:ribonuclease-3
MRPDWPLGWLSDRLAYEPRDASLFEAALTHRSASGRNNERLEFLGDAVLNLVAADQLFRLHPDADEGDLSRLRARIVSAEPLAAIGQDLGLGEVLQLGSGELKTGGFRRQSILADALEAVIGAIYLDRGLEAARRIGITPAQCLVFEDAEPGLEAARRAGMRVIDIRRWFTPRRISG